MVTKRTISKNIDKYFMDFVIYCHAPSGHSS